MTGISLTEAAATMSRTDFIHLKLSRHLARVDINVGVLTPAEWFDMCRDEDLSVIDTATGWTDLVAGGADSSEAGEPPIIFRYCPELIALTTDYLPVMADGPGGSVDLYLDLVEHIIDHESIRWATEPDPVRRRELAENEVYHLMDREDPVDGEVVFAEGPMALLSDVQSRALSLYMDEE